MTINKAKDFLQRLKSKASDKREVKIYQKFIVVLDGVENRKLPTSQRELIEEKLTSLELENNPKNRKKHIRKKLNEFIHYLESEFSFVLKGHYANYGISIGMVFGISIGTGIFNGSDGIALGMCFGICIGYIIGIQMDKRAAKQNQVLNLA